MNLEKRVGLATVRVWGLIANLVANAALLYGAVGYIADGSRLPLLLLGAVVTAGCIAVLSSPSR